MGTGEELRGRHHRSSSPSQPRHRGPLGQGALGDNPYLLQHCAGDLSQVGSWWLRTLQPPSADRPKTLAGHRPLLWLPTAPPPATPLNQISFPTSTSLVGFPSTKHTRQNHLAHFRASTPLCHPLPPTTGNKQLHIGTHLGQVPPWGSRPGCLASHHLQSTSQVAGWFQEPVGTPGQTNPQQGWLL